MRIAITVMRAIFNLIDEMQINSKLLDPCSKISPPAIRISNYRRNPFRKI